MSNYRAALIVGLILVVGCLPLTAQTYTLQALSVPWAPNADTFVQGINNRGAIVGNCTFVAFKRNANGTFEPPIFDPNTGQNGSTVANGLNDSGVIAGYYFNGNQTNFPGFLRINGIFNDYYVVPGRNTLIRGINNKGDLVGKATGSDGLLHGFISINGVVSEVDFPGGNATRPNGISADGTIVGSFRRHRMTMAFLRGPAGNYAAIRIPGAIDSTAYGVNNAAHKIVGEYGTSGQTHGFVYDYITGDITTVDWPDPKTYHTVITGINSHGVIVGWAQVSGQTPATISFIGTPQ